MFSWRTERLRLYPLVICNRAQNYFRNYNVHKIFCIVIFLKYKSCDFLSKIICVHTWWSSCTFMFKCNQPLSLIPVMWCKQQLLIWYLVLLYINISNTLIFTIHRTIIRKASNAAIFCKCGVLPSVSNVRLVSRKSLKQNVNNVNIKSGYTHL